MQCTLDPHKKYKLEQATDMKERLSTLFLNVTFKYDKSIHIIKKNKKKYCLTPWSTSLGTPRRHLCLELNNLGGNDNPLHIPINPVHRLHQTTQYRHGQTIKPCQGTRHKTIVKILKPILLVSIPHLIKSHRDQDLLREVTTTLNEFMEMEEQIQVNNNLVEKLDTEDAQ